jgi:hypothetical protein
MATASRMTYPNEGARVMICTREAGNDTARQSRSLARTRPPQLSRTRPRRPRRDTHGHGGTWDNGRRGNLDFFCGIPCLNNDVSTVMVVRIPAVLTQQCADVDGCQLHHHQRS